MKMKQYFSFRGTASRSEYWAVLFAVFALGWIGGTIVDFLADMRRSGSPVTGVMYYLCHLYLYNSTAAGLLLFFATTVRRLRDAGLSPWLSVVWLAAWFLAAPDAGDIQTPYFGFIATVVIGCLSNRASRDRRNKNSYEYARGTYEQSNQEEYQQKQEESQKSEPMGEYARYRSILGISTSSTWEEVKLAYRRLAMKHHPDRGGDIKIFQELQHAYQKLEILYR